MRFTFLFCVCSAAFSLLNAIQSIEIPNFITKDMHFTDAPFAVSKDGPTLPKPLSELQYHGTTTLAFVCGDGIILAVDSKASVGSYVGSRTVKKIFPISSHILATMAGGAADCAFWIRRTACQAKVLEYEHGSPLRVFSVAKLLAASLREYRGSELSVGTMVAGFDLLMDKPALFYVDSEGSCVPGDFFCVGSGANLAYSVIDDRIKEAKDMRLEEAVELATWAIRHATYRDGYSGGYINVFHINSSGCHHTRRVDSRTLSMLGGQGKLPM